MSVENPLWGAPRIHGELLKLGFEVAQSTVAKYMVKRDRSPGQSWWTFLRNHAPDIAAMDLFVVPTLAFSVLYGFVIVRLDRRELVWIAVTSSPTAEWIERQITEAFPWESAPEYLIRDRRGSEPIRQRPLRLWAKQRFQPDPGSGFSSGSFWGGTTPGCSASWPPWWRALVSSAIRSHSSAIFSRIAFSGGLERRSAVSRDACACFRESSARFMGAMW
jgi:hypothetical protein